MVLFIDLLICRQPFHLAHIFLPALFGLTYLIFCYVYWAATGDVLYSVLNWNNPGAASTVGGIILIIVLPLFYMLIYFLFLWRRCCGLPGPALEASQESEPQDSDPTSNANV